MYRIDSVEARKHFVQDMLTSVTFTHHALPDTNYTVAIATFKDGWSTLGYSVCVSSADYREVIGQSIANENALEEAKKHYWRTVGYLAMQGVKEL